MAQIWSNLAAALAPNAESITALRSLPLIVSRVAYPAYSSARFAVAASESLAMTITCSPSRRSRRALRSAALESAAEAAVLGDKRRQPQAAGPQSGVQKPSARGRTNTDKRAGPGHPHTPVVHPTPPHYHP